MGKELVIDDSELVALIERFEVFLKKLEDRALELQNETLEAAQEISDYDEIRYHHFQVGIRGQFRELPKKARQIFKDQIKKKSLRNYIDYDNIRMENSVLGYEKKINNAENLLNDFEEKIEDIVNSIFDKVKVVSPKEKLNQVLAEYETIKENFCCQQCGAKLKLDQVYFVSTYITCEYCQTQNTFIPSMKMALLPDLVRDIANQSTGDLERPIKGNNFYEQFIRYEDHSRKQYFIKKKLIPQLSKSYQDIFVREISDFLLGNDLDQKSKSDILNHYGQNYIQKLIDQYNDKNEDRNPEKKKKDLEIIISNIELNKKLLTVKALEDSHKIESLQQEFTQKEEEIKTLLDKLKY